MKHFTINGFTAITWPAAKVVLAMLVLTATPESSVAKGNLKPVTKSAVIKDITGRVTDSRGEGLPGVNVLVKGTGRGTSTDANGVFNIAVNDSETLLFSFIGFSPREVKVGSETSLTVKLDTDQKQLEELVVVGYGTQTRKNLVGSIAKINASETKELPVASLDAQLQGKAAGVQINNNSGVPGDAVFVRVRGTTSINSGNDPLYIVDGVFLNNESMQTISTGGRKTSPIADINPADIESMEVLKDASATAIYGARGANGVIIITTKRGDYNSRSQVNVNISQGSAWAPKSKLWKLADGPTTAQAVNDNWIQTGIDLPALKQTEANRPFRPVSEGGKGLPKDQQTYDRLSRIIQVAPLKEYDISLQGGTAATKYYIAGAYTKQESVLKPAYFTRGSFKVNLDQRVNDHVTIGVSNGLSRSLRNSVGAGDGAQGNILSSATLVQATYQPIYNADGTPSLAGNRDNVDVLLEDTDMKFVSLRYIGNIYGDVQLLPNLKFRTSWSLDHNNYDEKGYWSDRMLAGAAGGAATSSISQNSTWINEQTLTYRNKFASKHNVGLLLGNSVQSNTIKNTTAKGTGFPNNSYKQISSASILTNSESWTQSSLASFFSRADYNYAGKYSIEVSVRADGSSRFGANNKWGYFPSLGAAWRVKEEAFLKNANAISELKLRGSVGLTGNQNGIQDFAAQGLWTGGLGYADNEGSGYKAGTAPQQLANPNLRWEKTRQVNFGVDLGLLENKVNIELNYYNKYTTDALLQLPVAGITGFNTFTSNAGEVSNKGFEFSVSTVNVRKRDFTWNTNFNISSNKNRIEVLPVPTTYYSRDWIRLEQGYSMYSFWLYKQLYVDPQTGDAVYEDVNKDGRITVADRQIIGTALPKFFGGLTNSISYHGFDASLLFTFQTGNKIWNHNRFLSMNGGTRDSRSLYADDANYWKKPGDITNVPRFTSAGNNWALEQNSRLLEDGSFLRLKSLSIGYTIPKELISKYVQSLRVYFNGTNLILLSKYSGPDPESNVSNASQMIQGIDFGTPPQPASIQLGINVTL
jgi:TonB-linked SusC/RagA family outer membrane protein